ncbi:unnamed protein product [Durusdinium trenchii]|uniref:Uncharacterized protein n=1 Tax=Durusdinium trenchii TaxID=1381693 RepID=A0ABP0R2Q7_9DINO
MAGPEDAEDCAMTYLKEQHNKPAVRKAKPRCETDAAMEYLKGQLAKQRKGGKSSPKVPLPDYLRGIRLQNAEAARRLRVATSNPNSPAKFEPTHVHDAYFSPGSDVRKTLELIQSKVGAPRCRPQTMPPQCVVPPQTSQAAQVVPEVRRSASAKRLRATSQDADARQQAQQHAQHVAVAAVASPAWTARSLRVPVGRSVPPSFREVLEPRPESEASVAAPTSWVKTYTKILQAQAVKTNNGTPVSGSHQCPTASPGQAWRSQPVVPIGLGSFRLSPHPAEADERSPNSGYLSARIRVEEKPDKLEAPAQGPENDQKESESVSNATAPAAPPRAALTPCNFTPTLQPEKKKEDDEKEKAPEKTPEKALEKSPEKTPEKILQTEKHENTAPQPVPSPARAPQTWSPAPGMCVQEYMKPHSLEVCRLQGISTLSTTSANPGTYMSCSTPPMPMTPPVPMRVGDPNVALLRGKAAHNSWVHMQRGISHGVYRTYSVQGPTPVPWFPKAEAQRTPWQIQRDGGSPLRRRQINV